MCASSRKVASRKVVVAAAAIGVKVRVCVTNLVLVFLLDLWGVAANASDRSQKATTTRRSDNNARGYIGQSSMQLVAASSLGRLVRAATAAATLSLPVSSCWRVVVWSAVKQCLLTPAGVWTELDPDRLDQLWMGIAHEKRTAAL